MSDSAQPKRHWFQFHLLTLVLMSLAFGALLAIETVYRESVNHWLRMIVLYLLDVDPPPPIVFNILFNIVAVAILALVSESILRRREARKP